MARADSSDRRTYQAHQKDRRRAGRPAVRRPEIWTIVTDKHDSDTSHQLIVSLEDPTRRKAVLSDNRYRFPQRGCKDGDPKD